MADLRLTLLVCTVLAQPVAAVAEPVDYADRQKLEAEVTRVLDADTHAGLARRFDQIMLDAGLQRHPSAVPAVANETFVPTAGSVIEMVDIRLLLAQIAVQSGARDHVALVRAQGDREHDVILLRGGYVSADEFFDLAAGSTAKAYVTRSQAGIVLARPLFIWADAGLSVQPGDHLFLDRANGSFVANLGWLDVAGGAISGSDGPNPAEPDFRPFVMTAGQGRLTARSAAFATLGFGASAVFGGVSVVNNGLEVPKAASFVVDSALTDVATLAVMGTTDAMLSGNAISDASGTAILLSNAKNTVVIGNTLMGMTGGQGIRIAAGSNEVLVRENLLSGTAKLGIAIDGNSTFVSVSGNLVAGSLATGIAVSNAGCVTITDNLVAANGGSGIGLAHTEAATVRGNALLFNQGSGLLLRDQTEADYVTVSSNVLIGNRDGLRGATTGNVTISGNDLEGQLPRVFAGDLAPLTVDWLRDRQNATAPTQPAGSSTCADQRGDG